MAVLQYAIDVTDQAQALSLAKQAVDNGVVCMEAGHVLVKAVGVQIVTRFKELDSKCIVVADMKTMDMGADEVEIAVDAGADRVMVCGAASDGVIEAAVETARRRGVKIIASLMGVRDQYTRALELEPLGVDFILAHRGIDDKFNWFDPEHSEVLRRMAADVKTPLAIGGGINESNYPMLNGMGFSVIISGRGITEAPDPGKAARRLVDLSAESVVCQA